MGMAFNYGKKALFMKEIGRIIKFVVRVE